MLHIQRRLCRGKRWGKGKKESSCVCVPEKDLRKHISAEFFFSLSPILRNTRSPSRVSPLQSQRRHSRDEFSAILLSNSAIFDFFLSTNGNARSRPVDTKQAWQGETTARQVFRIDTRENNRRVLQNDTREMQQKGEVWYTPRFSLSRHVSMHSDTSRRARALRA